MRPFVKPLRQKHVEWINHDGIVWCPTTPNGTWLARRNGTCYYTGNSGFGGLARGIELAGFPTIMAANHNRYNVEVHEANDPHAEHWIANLIDRGSSGYHSACDLPDSDLHLTGVSCRLGGCLGWAQCAVIAAGVGLTLDQMKAINQRFMTECRSRGELPTLATEAEQLG